MKCKNPECNNEVRFDRQNNQFRKVFCSNLCCKNFHLKNNHKGGKTNGEKLS
jgi:hypothetical protein